MTLIATTLTALLLVSSLSVTHSATTTATTPEPNNTTTPESCVITLEPDNLIVPLGEARSVKYNNGKDYVIYNCTDTSTSTTGDSWECDADKCAHRTSATQLHTCQACLLVYQAIASCIDTDDADCSDTDICTNNPDEGTGNCCGTCKDYLTAA